MVVAPAQRMRVISWNLLHGQKIPPTNSQDWQAEVVSAAKKIADELQPNFIALQEVDYFQSRSNLTNQTKLVAESMQLKYWAYLPTLIGTPGEKWRSVKDLKNSIITESSIDKNPKASYGIALATNWPIKKLYVKKLGRSIIGMPLLIPKDDGRGVRFIYVKDEPRVALIAELENGYTIATTHLSFVPGVNIFQLNKLTSYLKKLPGLALLTGDLNLPANLPSKLSGFKSLISQATYPSWKPKIQFDYIMLRKSEIKSVSSIKPMKSTATGISDHTPIGVEIQI
uniref:endonuclease/exonuclease/phosphatase family protein n=1 Tax=Candidatus Nanopelagicus sp. TaxID=2518620 RepID=UPI00404AFD36